MGHPGLVSVVKISTKWHLCSREKEMGFLSFLHLLYNSLMKFPPDAIKEKRERQFLFSFQVLSSQSSSICLAQKRNSIPKSSPNIYRENTVNIKKKIFRLLSLFRKFGQYHTVTPLRITRDPTVHMFCTRQVKILTNRIPKIILN